MCLVLNNQLNIYNKHEITKKTYQYCRFVKYAMMLVVQTIQCHFPRRFQQLTALSYALHSITTMHLLPSKRSHHCYFTLHPIRIEIPKTRNNMYIDIEKELRTYKNITTTCNS